MRKFFPAILFFGSLWGIIEATLGWLLHLFHFKGTSFIVLPFAITFMFLAIRKSGTPKAAFGVAIVASVIKLSNLFIGSVPVYWVVNPAVSILLEGIAFYLVYRLVHKQGPSAVFSIRNFLYGSLIFFAFQLLFCEYRMSIQLQMGANPYVLLQSFEGSLFMSLMQGLYRMGLTLGILYLLRSFSENKLQLRMSHSFVLLFISLILTNVCL